MVCPGRGASGARPLPRPMAGRKIEPFALIAQYTGRTGRSFCELPDGLGPGYRGTVKKITISVPDDVYRDARICAAERGSSVSALVGEYLRSLSERDSEF